MVKRFKEKSLVYILLIVFILTELIDLFMDHLLGNSITHSILQLVLFLFLFIVTYRLFEKYSNKKIRELVPQELMEILKIIKDKKKKGVMINQTQMRKAINITKPTLKKKVDALIELQYISFKKRGNNKYFILTELGNSVVD